MTLLHGLENRQQIKINMKTIPYFPLFMCALLSVAACNDDDDNDNNLSTYDRDFLTSAAHANLAEIEAGKVASTRADDDAVQDYGEHMVTDHTTAWNDLKGVADNEKQNLPEEPDDAHKQKLEYLRNLSGYSFDTAYINSQVKDHEMAIALFEDASDNADDEDVKDYATRYLPHLEDHLTDAQAIKARLDINMNPD
jgi:putative membrane protein